MSPAVFTLIITALGALGSFLGVLFSGLGKRKDQAAQRTTDEFNRLMEEIAYWHKEALDCREARQKDSHSD